MSLIHVGLLDTLLDSHGGTQGPVIPLRVASGNEMMIKEKEDDHTRGMSRAVPSIDPSRSTAVQSRAIHAD